MTTYFTLIWITIIGVAVLMYVVLDGFDLGVGILSRNAPTRDDRHLMIACVSPFWDGNETWLILVAIGLLAAFPLAFAVIVPALYFPVLLMLMGLMFRGVAFEYRSVPGNHVTFWDWAFFGGSLVAAFAQGIMLGMFVEGFTVTGREFTGSSFDWVAPFPLIAGVGLVFGYALLGAGWLVLKTEGELQARARRLGRFALLGVLAAIVIVSLWTPAIDPLIAHRWFSWPNLAFLAPVPIVAALLAWFIWRALSGRGEAGPFVGAVGLFLVSYIGIAISLWPMIVPHHYTLWQAASSESTQAFLLVGTLFLLPVILLYTGWSYWVFRGKVRADIGYH